MYTLRRKESKNHKQEHYNSTLKLALPLANQREQQFILANSYGFLDGSVVKNPPAMQGTQETRVQSLVQEDSLE